MAWADGAQHHAHHHHLDQGEEGMRNVPRCNTTTPSPRQDTAHQQLMASHVVLVGTGLPMVTFG